MIVRSILIHGISDERPDDWHVGLARKVMEANPLATHIFFPINWEKLRDESKKSSDELEDVVSDLSVVFDAGLMAELYEKVSSILNHPKDENQKLMIVGHSYGSVMAYMACHAYKTLNPDAGYIVDLMVTLGSPIWIADRGPLKGIFRKPRKPAIVRRWRNVVGLFDPITLFGLGKISAADTNHLAFVRHDLDSYLKSSVVASALSLTGGGLWSRRAHKFAD